VTAYVLELKKNQERVIFNCDDVIEFSSSDTDSFINGSLYCVNNRYRLEDARLRVKWRDDAHPPSTFKFVDE